MASIEFSDSYRIVSFGYPDNYIRVNYTETEYDAQNNRTKVRLDGVYIKYTGANANCRCFGTLKFNGTTVLSMDGSPYILTVDDSYTLIPDTDNGATVWVQHSASGTASLTVTLSGGTRNDDNDDVFGALWYYGSGYPVIGVRTPESKSVSLTTHTSTLYINANGGYWSGYSSYSQAPTSTINLGSPTRSGYTFAGWSLSGGGSLSGSIYTFGASNGTLTAKWTANSYTVTCQDRVGNSSGALLGSSTTTRTYGSSISGSAWGSSATYNQYYTGYYYIGCTSATVNGNVTVYRYFAVNTYSLALTKSDSGITVNVSRVTSPYGGAQAGLLANGATLYYGDTISISWAVTSGYMADTLEINSVDVSAETPPYPVTVSNSVSVVMTVKLGAIVYIANDLYQAFIWDGSNWVQYEAYIYNGANWDAY